MVIETGMPTPFLVFHNCDVAERQVSGTGAPRSVCDVLAFQGVKARSIEIAVANAMVRSYQATFKPTKQQQIQYHAQHKDAVDWTLGAMWKRSKGIGQAAMLAPVARAYYSESLEKLTRFLEVFRTGLPEGESEYAIVLLRNYALESSGRSSASHTESYGRAERALRGFLDGERIKLLRPLSEEIFPIPGEAGAKKRQVRRKGSAR